MPRVCRTFEGSVSLVKQHASEVDDIPRTA